jgi:Tol biopolymer transport system component
MPVFGSRQFRLTLLVSCIAACGVALVAQQAQPQDLRLQAAIRLETVDGNLRAAIVEYTAIAREYEKKDRRVAALATLHLAGCYRKLGESRARAVYEDIPKKYRDLPDIVALARTQLAQWADELSGQHLAWTEPPDGDILGDVAMNGRMVAFTDWSERGKGDVFVQTLGARNARRVISSEKDAAGNVAVTATDAVFSHDGLELAYNWIGPNRSAELRILTLAGGRPALLFSNPDVCCLQPLAWAPDGSSIAVMLQKRDSTAQLALISVETGAVRTLKPLSWRRPARAAFSSDGRLLAFDLQGQETNARDIYAIRLNDGQELSLVSYRGNDLLVGFAPDNTLVFTSDRTATVGLYTAQIADDRAGSARLLRGDLGRFSAAGISATGAIYYCRCNTEGGSDIRMGTFDMTNGNFVGSMVDAVQEFVGTNSQPFWSPDGQSFVYRSLRGINQDPVLAIRPRDLGEPRELRPKLRTFIDPRWSPDAKTVSVLGRDFEGRYGFFRVDVQTAAVAPIALALPGDTFFASDPRMSWTPGGDGIYFRRTTKTEFHLVEWNLSAADEKVLLQIKDGSGRGVHLTEDGALIYMNPVVPGRAIPFMIRRDLATGVEKELIRGAPHLRGVNPSPDGKWIATVTGKRDKYDTVTLVSPNGGPSRDIWQVAGRAEVGDPEVEELTGGRRIAEFTLNSWMPDSQSLIVTKVLPDDLGVEYWWVPIDGREPHRIDALRGLVLPGRLRFHPDGRTVVFAATEADTVFGPTELWVFEDLFERAVGKR